MSDKFKLSQKEREELSFILQTFYVGKQDYDIAINAFEQLIQDRGNSIEDGWIDVSDPPKEDGSYLMLFGFANPFMYVCHYYTSIGFGPDTLKWQPLPPLPSAPKQPKK